MRQRPDGLARRRRRGAKPRVTGRSATLVTMLVPEVVTKVVTKVVTSVVITAVALATVCGLSTAALATVPIVDGDNVRFSLAGYAKSFTGLQHIGYDTLGLIDANTGMNSTVFRLEWRLGLGDILTFDLHQRLFWQLSSSELGSLGGLGLGVSTPPNRNVDLSWRIVEEDLFFLEHDIDRLELRVYTDAGDLTVGRQAITWGSALLFPVSDNFTTFSPYEIDTTEKRGVDAVRFIAPAGDRAEVEIVLADQGALSDLSGGVRTTMFLDTADVYFGVAKFWDEIAVISGVSADLGSYSLRAEAMIPYLIDDAEVDLPRASLGFDYFTTDLMLSFEYFFNGAGTTNPDEYADLFQTERFARGEVYLVGQHYLGALASWQAHELLSFALGTITNLTDPSVILTPQLLYKVADNADVLVGAYTGFGASPDISISGLVLDSEFGSFGNLYYLQLASYW